MLPSHVLIPFFSLLIHCSFADYSEPQGRQQARMRLPSCGIMPTFEVALLDEFHNNLETWGGGELELVEANNLITFTSAAADKGPKAARQVLAQGVATFANLHYVSAAMGDIELIIRAVPKKKVKGLAVRLEEVVVPVTVFPLARVVDVDLKLHRAVGQVSV